MKGKIQELAKEAALYPQEQLLKVKENFSQLCIGMPKEAEGLENRISLTPEAVSILVNNGHEILIETGAGNAARFTDRDYSEAGAKIAYSQEEVFSTSDIVLKIDSPTPDQVNWMKPGKTIISALQIGKLKAELLEKVNQKKITALAYEYIEEKNGGKPIVKAMSEIAGSTVMLIAAEYLNSYNGKGVILGGITGVPPTKVLILGAGTVAEYAARTALGLGAHVMIFDSHLYKLRRIKHILGYQIYTSTIDVITLSNELKRADVVIGSLRSDEGSPCVVTEEIVQSMKENSVIIDVSIDQGGCFETSKITDHKSPIFRRSGIIHYCVPNIPSRVARTASTALSNILLPMLLEVSKAGGIDSMLYAHDWFMKGIYSYKGNLTNAFLARKFNMSYKDLELLIATRF